MHRLERLFFQRLVSPNACSFSTFTVSSDTGNDHDVIVDIFCTGFVELCVAFRFIPNKCAVASGIVFSSGLFSKMCW